LSENEWKKGEEKGGSTTRAIMKKRGGEGRGTHMGGFAGHRLGGGKRKGASSLGFSGGKRGEWAASAHPNWLLSREKKKKEGRKKFLCATVQKKRKERRKKSHSAKGR